MNALVSSYLRGLRALKIHVEKDGNDDQVVSILQMRLKENIEKMRIQGDTRDISAERMVILSTANEITERIFGLSFDDFCQSYIPKGQLSRTEEKAEDQADLSLTSAEREALKAALLSAFPSPGDLQRVVTTQFSENLSVIARGNDYDEIVFKLILWVQDHGKTEGLITGARRMNPGDPILHAFEKQYRVRHPLSGNQSKYTSLPSHSSSLEVFISYAYQDRALRDELAKHLSNLRKQNIIRDWYNGDISPGTERKAQILSHLNTAQIILLLISADYLASDFCYSIEMQQAIARHHANQARVIPIILRPTDWEGAPFADLQVLPTNDVPVSKWTDKDDAFHNVVRGIRKAIRDLNGQKLSAP